MKFQFIHNTYYAKKMFFKEKYRNKNFCQVKMKTRTRSRTKMDKKNVNKRKKGEQKRGEDI